MPATYEPIATQTLVSAGTITFSSIPATYTDLRLIFTVIGTGTNDTYLRFNSDTATNYSITTLTGNGSAASSGRSTSQTLINLDEAIAAQPSFFSVDIFSYAGSTFKTVLANLNSDRNGSGYVSNRAGLWRSTSAITSITLSPSASTFAIGTSATLYGIKAA
jgi:hypothetical protein